MVFCLPFLFLEMLYLLQKWPNFDFNFEFELHFLKLTRKQINQNRKPNIETILELSWMVFEIVRAFEWCGYDRANQINRSTDHTYVYTLYAVMYIVQCVIQSRFVSIKSAATTAWNTENKNRNEWAVQQQMNVGNGSNSYSNICNNNRQQRQQQ